MNILLAVDGSEYSLRVVDALVAHVASLREVPTVHVLYVHLPIPVGFATRHVARELVDGYYHEEGQAIIGPVAERLTKGGIPAISHVRVGAPGETIAHAARDLQCGAIWMGTHGRGAVTQALLGSVAARVVALSHIPVTLVR